MTRDRIDIIVNDGALTDEGGYTIARHGGESDIVAVRAGRPIRHAEFRRDVAALAARLPGHEYILNICTDRYRFMVGLAASLQRRQVSLMSSSHAPGVLKALAADYPDLYALTDTVQTLLPNMAYPDDLEDGGPTPALQPVPETQPALVLFTSGSTGKPKPVPKSWGTLIRSARAAGDRLGLSRLRNPTVIGTVPHQHSYGLESAILLGLQHGLIVDAGLPLYPGDIRAAIERAPGSRILVTTPVHLRALLAEPDGMPQADLILSATAPLPVSLAAQAEACFGAPLVEIYGCTEAGQVATRRTAHETQWHCLDGVDLSQDEHGTWASGASVEGRALLQDIIEPTGPATFLLGDRSADLVDVAGKRTSLAHLNHQLLSIAGVKDGVFLMGEAEGRRVARPMALVVAPDLRSETVLRALRERIDAAFLPRPLVFVDELPRNALGKLPREALLRLAGRGQGA
jgi:acyl-coenzyme A synthetase/AMP-(fatty) acid ligase